MELQEATGKGAALAPTRVVPAGWDAARAEGGEGARGARLLAGGCPVYCRARAGVRGSRDGGPGKSQAQGVGPARPGAKPAGVGSRPDPGCARPGPVKQPPLPGRAVQRGRLGQQPPAPAPGPARTCCRRRPLPPAQRKCGPSGGALPGRG